MLNLLLQTQASLWLLHKKTKWKNKSERIVVSVLDLFLFYIFLLSINNYILKCNNYNNVKRLALSDKSKENYHPTLQLF